MRLKDISITAKLLSSFGIVLLLLTVISSLCWLGFGSIRNENDRSTYTAHLYSEILAQEMDHLKFANQISIFFSYQAPRPQEAVTHNQQDGLGAWLSGPDRKKAEQHIPRLVPLLENLERLHAQLHESIQEIKDMATRQEQGTGLPGDRALYEAAAGTAMASVQTLLHEAAAVIKADADTAQQQFDASISFNRRVVLFLAVLSIGAGLLICLALAGNISGVARHLTAITRHLAKGDLTARSTVEQKDEMGRFACATNTLAATLDNMCQRVHCASSTINASSLNLDKLSASLFSTTGAMSESCTSIASAVEQMKDNMTAIAATAEETSANFDMVATATEEMTATITEIAAGSEKARNIAVQAVEEADKAAAIVQELGSAAHLINKVTETINAIAYQTNLLALNATIEAARAGEAGKGFAVIAEEIQYLAQQTTEATREVQERIEGVQQSSEQTIASITTITKIINETRDIVSSVAAAVEEQAVTGREIAANIHQASVGVQDVTENIAQASLANALVSKDVASVKKEALLAAAGSSDVRELATEIKSYAAALELLLQSFTFRPAQFDIGKIKDAHFNWKMRLTAVLRGYAAMDSKNIPDHHQCDFGKWYTNAPEKIKAHALFEAVGLHHEAVHRKAVEAVDMFNADNACAARNKVNEFEEVRKKLFGYLDEMYISEPTQAAFEECAN